VTTTPIRRPAPRHVTRTVIGYPHEIDRIIAANQRTGRLVTVSKPVPAPDATGRIIVALRLRADIAGPVQRPWPAPARAPRRPSALRPGRTVAIAAAVGTAVAAVVGLVLYVAVRLVLDLLGLLSANATLLVGIGVVALVLAAGAAYRCCCPTCGR
jgi:hypothetical protein